MRLALLRRALLPAVVAAAALLGGASAARAQTIGAFYAPGCGSGTACSLFRFRVTNQSASPMLLNSLTLTTTRAPFAFAASAGGMAIYQAVDAVGPFGGAATVAPGGTDVFIDFLGGNGFAFELAAHTEGYVEIPLLRSLVLDGRSAFAYAGTLEGGASISGTVAAVPEPTTVALLGGGLALLGVAARRRRRA